MPPSAADHDTISIDETMRLTDEMLNALHASQDAARAQIELSRRLIDDSRETMRRADAMLDAALR